MHHNKDCATFIDRVIVNVYPDVHHRYLKTTTPFALAKMYRQYMDNGRSWFSSRLPSADRLKLITHYGHFFILFEYFRAKKTQSDDPSLQEFVKIVQAAFDKMQVSEAQTFFLGTEYSALREPLMQYCKDSPAAMQENAREFIQCIRTDKTLEQDEFSKEFLKNFSGKKEFEYHHKSNDTVVFSDFSL